MNRANSLYVVVDTLNRDDEVVSSKVVNLKQYGTPTWLQKHQCWALHSGHTVVVMVAKDDEVEAYLESRRKAMAEHFNERAA